MHSSQIYLFQKSILSVLKSTLQSELCIFVRWLRKFIIHAIPYYLILRVT